MALPEVIIERVGDLKRRVDDIAANLKEFSPEVIATRLANLDDDVRELRDEFRGLRRLLITFTITVAAAAVGFAITTLAVWGKGTPHP